MTETLRRVDAVKIDDGLDLEGDKFADPDRDNVGLQFDLARVDEIERDGAACIVLHTSQGSFGFPPDHLVKVESES